MRIRLIVVYDEAPCGRGCRRIGTEVTGLPDRLTIITSDGRDGDERHSSQARSRLKTMNIPRSAGVLPSQYLMSLNPREVTIRCQAWWRPRRPAKTAS